MEFDHEKFLLTPITTYGQAREFCSYHFEFFNSKINPIMPARYLIFELNNDEHIFGDNLGDLVNINLQNCMRLLGTIPDRVFKGTLIYLIIHELLHMDQDIEYYYNKYRRHDYAINHLENSCHAITYSMISLYKKSITDASLCDYFDIPLISDYIDINIIYKIAKSTHYENIDVANAVCKTLGKEFVTLKSPISKVMWIIIKTILNSDYKYFSNIIKTHMNILLEVRVNERFYSGCWLQYLWNIGYWRDIMDTYRIVLLICKQNRYKDNLHKDIEVTLQKNIYDKNIFKFVIHLEDKLDIATVVPKISG